MEIDLSCSSVLALPLGLVGREMGPGCVLGTCFRGWVCLFFCSCARCGSLGRFSRRTSYFPFSGGCLVHGTFKLDQCVSLSLIDVGVVQPFLGWSCAINRI